MIISNATDDNINFVINMIDEEFIYKNGKQISVRYRFPDIFENKKYIFVCNDGEVVGACVCKPITNNNNEEFKLLGFVVIKKEFRKKNYGKKMLEYIIDGKDYILWTKIHNFYKHFGFREEDDGIIIEGSANKNRITNLNELSVNSIREIEEIRIKENNFIMRGADCYKRIPMSCNSVGVLFGENSYLILGCKDDEYFVYDYGGDRKDINYLLKDLIKKTKLTINVRCNEIDILKDLGLAKKQNLTMVNKKYLYLTFFDRI